MRITTNFMQNHTQLWNSIANVETNSRTKRTLIVLAKGIPVGAAMLLNLVFVGGANLVSGCCKRAAKFYNERRGSVSVGSESPVDGRTNNAAKAAFGDSSVRPLDDSFSEEDKMGEEAAPQLKEELQRDIQKIESIISQLLDNTKLSDGQKAHLDKLIRQTALASQSIKEENLEGMKEKLDDVKNRLDFLDRSKKIRDRDVASSAPEAAALEEEEEEMSEEEALAIGLALSIGDSPQAPPKLTIESLVKKFEEIPFPSVGADSDQKIKLREALANRLGQIAAQQYNSPGHKVDDSQLQILEEEIENLTKLEPAKKKHMPLEAQPVAAAGPEVEVGPQLNAQYTGKEKIDVARGKGAYLDLAEGPGFKKEDLDNKVLKPGSTPFQYRTTAGASVNQNIFTSRVPSSVKLPHLPELPPFHLEDGREIPGKVTKAYISISSTMLNDEGVTLEREGYNKLCIVNLEESTSTEGFQRLNRTGLFSDEEGVFLQKDEEGVCTPLNSLGTVDHHTHGQNQIDAAGGILLSQKTALATATVINQRKDDPSYSATYMVIIPGAVTNAFLSEITKSSASIQEIFTRLSNINIAELNKKILEKQNDLQEQLEAYDLVGNFLQENPDADDAAITQYGESLESPTLSLKIRDIANMHRGSTELRVISDAIKENPALESKDPSLNQMENDTKTLENLEKWNNETNKGEMQRVVDLKIKDKKGEWLVYQMNYGPNPEAGEIAYEGYGTPAGPRLPKTLRQDFQEAPGKRLTDYQARVAEAHTELAALHVESETAHTGELKAKLAEQMAKIAGILNDAAEEPEDKAD